LGFIQPTLDSVFHQTETLSTIMLFDILARNFVLTTDLRCHIERRLVFALSTREKHIQRVRVRLSDINPHDSKYCHIHVVLPQLTDVVVEDTEVNMYIAIDRAVNRVGRQLARRIDYSN